jgi:hypothetical protein
MTRLNMATVKHYGKSIMILTSLVAGLWVTREIYWTYVKVQKAYEASFMMDSLAGYLAGPVQTHLTPTDTALSTVVDDKGQPVNRLQLLDALIQQRLLQK